MEVIGNRILSVLFWVREGQFNLIGEMQRNFKQKKDDRTSDADIRGHLS